MKLVIISHTAHFLKNDIIHGWGPTVNEINELLEIFEKIWHVGFLHNKDMGSGFIPYTSNKIKFIPINPVGGDSVFEKIAALYYLPGTIRIVSKILKKSDIFQFRAPTGIGNYLIPYLSFFCDIPGWFKYGGNWVQKNPPLGYKFQRKFLKKYQNRKVTVNGKWDGSPAHIYSFENPCINEIDRKRGYKAILDKSYKKPWILCFVGRLGEKKGEKIFLQAAKRYPSNSDIKKIHIIGDGKNKDELLNISKDIDINIEFHGFIDKSKLSLLYSESNFIVLPSESEGFPKVIAEASNFGCIPIVSNVSSIPQYIKDDHNGFVWDKNNVLFESFFKKILSETSSKEIRSLSINAHTFAEKFTFNHYIKRLRKDILSS